MGRNMFWGPLFPLPHIILDIRKWIRIVHMQRCGTGTFFFFFFLFQSKCDTSYLYRKNVIQATHTLIHLRTQEKHLFSTSLFKSSKIKDTKFWHSCGFHAHIVKIGHVGVTHIYESDPCSPHMPPFQIGLFFIKSPACMLLSRSLWNFTDLLYMNGLV